MLTFDAHLDLAMSAMERNRDLSRPIGEIRERERGLTDKADRGRGTVCFPEMRRGRVGLCVATQIARYVRPGNARHGWHTPAQAWAATQGQLAWYRAMEEVNELVQIKDADALEQHVQYWRQWIDRKIETGNPREEKRPIGYILSLEGADSLITFGHLEKAYAQGLRAVGPAHYGPGTYAPGTAATGKLSPKGRELLKEMQRLRIILDVTHLTDESFWEAIELFDGHLWASHSNCRALVPHERQLSDEQIKVLIERGAVIGVALDAWMLFPGWVKHETRADAVGLKLERLVEHIDHVCQIAGNACHSGMGTDLDGGFGNEQTPVDMDTIADVARLPELLRDRNYSEDDIRRIMHGNFVRFLHEAWTDSVW